MSYLNNFHEFLYIEDLYGNSDFHWKRVKAIMKQPEVWRAVEALAKELMIRKRIHYKEATRIIEDTSSQNDNHPDE
jgi:hypothetical protein